MIHFYYLLSIIIKESLLGVVGNNRLNSLTNLLI